MAKFDRGLIQVFTGEGKGKTWAALGLAFRALNFSYSVYLIQFLKGSGSSWDLIKMETTFPNFKIDSFGRHCPYIDIQKSGLLNCDDCRECYVYSHGKKDLDRQMAQMALDLASKVISSGDYQVVILDEVNRAAAMNLIERSDLVKILEDKPEGVEVILTGNPVTEDIISAADRVIVFENAKEKIPPNFKSRKGIDY